MPDRLWSRLNLIGAATFLLGLLLWEASIRTKLLDFAYLPPPSRVRRST
jgi:ABC-type nitrate/sulfonate/bicarbonate transport system permease component